jgi:hypothetical protein
MIGISRERKQSRFRLLDDGAREGGEGIGKQTEGLPSNVSGRYEKR